MVYTFPFAFDLAITRLRRKLFDSGSRKSQRQTHPNCNWWIVHHCALFVWLISRLPLPEHLPPPPLVFFKFILLCCVSDHFSEYSCEILAEGTWGNEATPRTCMKHVGDFARGRIAKEEPRKTRTRLTRRPHPTALSTENRFSPSFGHNRTTSSWSLHHPSPHSPALPTAVSRARTSMVHCALRRPLLYTGYSPT